MKRTEARALINAILKVREKADDATAIEAAAIYPSWKPDASYKADERVRYDGILYRCITAHTSQVTWTPPNAPSLWAKVLIPDADVIPEWEQPDSTNPYMIGDRVTHGGKTWVCDVDNNVWEPGVYGWGEVKSLS